MRRNEFYTGDDNTIREILDAAVVGYLGVLTPDGYPRVVPLNFVRIDEIVYIHGANEGEKYESLKASGKVTFHVNIPLSVIPSYWISVKSAGGATQFYKSVQIKGRAFFIEDLGEKAAVLQKLMDKYQPEGGFKEIKPDDKMYTNLLNNTAVIGINAEKVTAKVKIGQQYPEERRRALIEKLEERGRAIDHATAEEIRKTL
ncbi:MAG: pyridoxamine 5'-phosphate oxidase family protein [candidate division Zixibacteria bacterium]|nr:pyridoxamine 5'-phosphate oxidase family protein [candidate division Zixibacteria bacterium]